MPYITEYTTADLYKTDQVLASDQKCHNGIRTASGALPPIPERNRKAMS